MANHQKTSSFSTESSQNLQDFSNSLATIALFRSKSNQTCLFTEYNPPKSCNILYNHVKNHRRTASNTLTYSLNKSHPISTCHRRNLSSFSAIPHENEFNSHEISKDLVEISKEIRKRQDNYEKITLLLDKYQQDLQLLELKSKTEERKSVQKMKISKMNYCENYSDFSRRNEEKTKEKEIDFYRKKDDYLLSEPALDRINKKDAVNCLNSDHLQSNNHTKRSGFYEERENVQRIVKKRNSICQEADEKTSFSCCSDSICSIF